MRTAWLLALLPLLANPTVAGAQTGQATPALAGDIDRLAAAAEKNVIGYRRHIHQNPELSNREVETAKYVAAHLQRLGFQVETGVAHTGVVGVLKGGRPGPVVALRADMDALPVTEEVDLPFASKVRSTYNGQEVGVMHACGHDAHVAVLMGVAEVLAQVRERIPGTVKLVFQPAEEGPPPGEEGGARLMVKQGVLSKDPQPEAIFGLHVTPMFEVGQVGYRAGGMLASGDRMRIVVRGRQTHGAAPWMGVDPVTVAAQIVLALQTIPSRQLDITQAPALVTIGSIHGGVRENIIPEQVELLGTVRALDRQMHQDFRERIRRTAKDIAESAGATAEVHIEELIPITYNDPDLTRRMLPTLRRTAGEANVVEAIPVLGGEDFAYYQEKIPGVFVWLGVRTKGAPRADFAPNHSPRFRMDEAALRVGVRTLANLAIDYLESGGGASRGK